MAWENRDYYRDQNSWQGGGGWRSHIGGANVGPVTLTLLATNVVVAIVNGILLGSARGDLVAPYWWGNYNVEQAIFGFQLWRPLTYQFLHSGFLHLLFNMFGLYIFGGRMESWWGSRRFLAFYLLCGLGGAVLFTLAAFVPAIAGTTVSTPVVGASACVMGCVIGCVLRFAREPLGMLFLPFTFTMQILGIFYIAMDLLQVLAGSAGAGGAVAHLGGVAAGLGLVLRPGVLGWAENVDIDAARDAIRKRRQERVRKAELDDEAELDRILDKVRQHGLHSLTKGEKKALQRSTERKKRAG